MQADLPYFTGALTNNFVHGLKTPGMQLPQRIKLDGNLGTETGGGKQTEDPSCITLQCLHYGWRISTPSHLDRQPNLCEEVVRQNVEAFIQVILFLESTKKKKVQSPLFSENFFSFKNILSQNKGRLLVEL